MGSLDLSDVDLAFRVERSVRREPNLAEIRVWNLSPTSRATVEAGGIVSLRAGYEDPPMLFRGDSRRVWTARDGIDVVTTIQARDGGRAYSESRIARSYGAGTRPVSVLRDVVAAMDIGEGNLADFESSFAMRNGSAVFAGGYVAHGSCRSVLNDLVRSAGLRWSVQNGSLQILRQGVPLQSRSVVLASDSGLVDSPAWDETGLQSRGRRGICTARALIQPGIEPGRQVQLESASISGSFEVRKATYTGETRGNDWYVALELRPSA